MARWAHEGELRPGAGMYSEQGEASEAASPENPQYRKQKMDGDPRGTNFYMIIVDEGWRSWILCADMYEWAADGLLEVLRTSGKVWPK